MAQMQSFMMAAIAVTILSLMPALFNHVEAKFGLSGLESDVFVDKRSSLIPERRSSFKGEGLISRLVSGDPCLNGAATDANGNPCPSSTNSVGRLIGSVKVGNHPPGVGKHPPGVGKHPPGVGKHPPRRGFNPPVPSLPGLPDAPPFVGRHPPGKGKNPPGTGHHPPGVGRHPPGVGKRCNKDPSRCRNVDFNPRLLIDPTAVHCCSKSCLSLINDWRACGGCNRSCGTRFDNIAHGCCYGRCVDLNKDTTCGGCFSCGRGFACTDGQCVDYNTIPPPPMVV